ncbi:MAG: YecA family protein [Planctomycetota bacterium]|jgi:hypothetical protein
MGLHWFKRDEGKLTTKDSTEAQHSHLVARYKGFREITRHLQNGPLPKYISKRTLDVCGKKLGVLQGNTFVLDDMDQIGAVMDYCIYDYREAGSNAVERYIADSRLDPDSDESIVVKAMSESFYTLVQVAEVVPGVGARARDLMNNREYLLIDMGLGKTATENVVIATRILPLEDFVITSGAALPVDTEALVEILDFALEHYGTEDGKHIELDINQRADLTAAIIRTCLHQESSYELEYQDVEAEPITSPLHRETHVGRNDPCPCGSGKKYKRCCGQSA